MLPLTFAAIGEETVVKRVGGDPEVKAHLENLGFVAGSAVTVINTIGGNVIVHIKNSRILYDDGMRKRLIA